MTKRNRNFLFQDTGIIVLSVLVAVLLVKTGAVSELSRIGSFVAGMFFTSIFTTAPAIVTLSEIARVNSIFSTALFGALGAVTGDIIIFLFVRDRFSDHLGILLSHTSAWKRFGALFRLKTFRWITFLVGGLIIASPLPDELGIGVLGFSKLKLSRFVWLSFVFNFIGIYIIGSIARSL